MSPIAHIRKTAWRCSCLACHLLNLFLAALAFGLGGLVLINLFQKSVPVPDKLASWVINKSGPEHLQARWSKVAFDLRAGLYLSGFELRNSQTEQIVLTAEETYMRWSPLHLVIPGSIALQEIAARDIQIYLPVSHSPTGLNEPVISIKHIYSHQDDGQLILGSLLLETGGLRLHMNGHAPLRTLLESSSADGSRPSIYPSLQKLGRLPKDLRADISATWEMLPSGNHIFHLNGFLPEFTFKNVGMEKISGDVFIFFSNNKLAIRSMNLHGILQYNAKLPSIPFLNIPDKPVPIPFDLSARGESLVVQDYQIPSNWKLSLHPDDSDIKFQHLILKANLTESLDNPIDWILMGPAAFASGSALPDKTLETTPLFSFPALYQFRAYLPDCSIYQFLDAPLPHRLLVGAKTGSLRLNTSFDPKKLHLQGSVVIDDLNIGQTQFDHLFLNLILNPDILVLDNALIRKSMIEDARGSYFHHFPSSKFSLNAAGYIFPSSLDSILGDWWAKLFTLLDAPQALTGDVTVWGQWRDIKTIKSITEAHGPGVSYRGVEIPDMEVRIRSNADWVYLDSLWAKFPEGEMEGIIAIRSNIKETDTHRAYILDMTSTGPWEAVLGATGLESLSIMDFRGQNPHLSIEGTFWRDSKKGFNSEENADMKLSIMQHDGSCLFKTLELSGLSVSGHLHGNQLDLSGVSGQFAEGIFTGSIGIINWQSEDRMRQKIDIDLINADYNKARMQLSGFVGMEPNTESTIKEDDLGRLDAELYLELGKELESYSGTGNISIHKGKLGTVHMFGELSRLLGSMGLGFTTVEMNSLYLDWDLTGPALEIKNGRVTGPALNLTMGGWVDLETQGLQMKSEVTLFSGLFSKVLSPVSDTLQFDLIGSLEDPQWRIRFNPFRWALNRMDDLNPPPSK